jgi:hypothetical protein
MPKDLGFWSLFCKMDLNTPSTVYKKNGHVKFWHLGAKSPKTCHFALGFEPDTHYTLHFTKTFGASKHLAVKIACQFMAKSFGV